jgi:alkylation response protein AidB-like acyl-CoA dehydrogenase
VFDQPIGRHQLVQEKIAGMSVGLEAARLLTYQLAWRKDRGATRLQKDAAIAKLFATDQLMRAADGAMQIHGAYSCSAEFDVGRIWRDAKFMQIYDGTNEIQTVMIAEHELGYRS